MTVGFIGAGNMGGALAKATAKAGTFDILVSDNDEQKSVTLATAVGGSVSTNGEIAKTADFIFLGVKPQILPKVAEQIAKILRSRTTPFVLVTMAAGITTQSVKSMFCDSAIIRIMPNTPALIGEGLILYCHSEKVTSADIDTFLKLTKSAGLVEPIEESLIDAGCAVSGCGPAFSYMFIEALAKGGAKAGLPYDTALKLAAKTVLGAGAMVLETGETPEKLCNAVCSPNGSTIEGVNHLKSTDFEQSVIDTVTASFNRTVELGKGK